MTMPSASSSGLQLKSQRRQSAQAVVRGGSPTLLLLCIPGLLISLGSKKVSAVPLASQ